MFRSQFHHEYVWSWKFDGKYKDTFTSLCKMNKVQLTFLLVNWLQKVVFALFIALKLYSQGLHSPIIGNNQEITGEVG